MAVRVRIVDNGVRCFVEPCYSWDIISETGVKIKSVARVVDSGGSAFAAFGDELVEIEFDTFFVAEGPNKGQPAEMVRVIVSAR